MSRFWPWARRGRDADAPTAEEARDERLSAYLDGELSSDEATTIRAELDADPALRETLEALRSVRTMLVALGELRAPRPFTIEATAARRQGVPRLELVARVGAAIAVLAFVAVASTDLAGLGDDDSIPAATQSELTANTDAAAAIVSDGADDASAAALAPENGVAGDGAAAPDSDDDAAFADDESGDVAEPTEEPTEALGLATAVTGDGGSDAARVATPSDDDTDVAPAEAATAEDMQGEDTTDSDEPVESAGGSEAAAPVSGDGGDDPGERASPADRTADGVIPPNTGEDDEAAGGSADVDGTAVASADQDTPPAAGEPSTDGEDGADTASLSRSPNDSGAQASESLPAGPMKLAVEMQDDGTDMLRVIEAGLLLAAMAFGALALGQWALRRRSN